MSAVPGVTREQDAWPETLAAQLTGWADLQPDRTALAWPAPRGRWHTVDFATLEAACRVCTRELDEAGVRAGQKAVVMARDPYDLVTTVYGLLALGAVPVLIDPALPRPALRACLDETRPEVFIGDPLAQLARLLLGWARPHITVSLLTGRARRAWRERRPEPQVKAERPEPSWPSPPPAASLALIAFTSGSTGVPKGVEYDHRQLAAQVRSIAGLLGLGPGEVLLAGFLPFALFGPATGATTVVPAIDHLRPARTRGADLARAVTEHFTSVVCASPAVLRALAGECEHGRLSLAPVRLACSFGAPPSERLVRALRRALPEEATLLSAYGATECLPVSVIDSTELAAAHAEPLHAHRGVCLGRPVPGITAHVLVPVGPVSYNRPVPQGGYGEITVGGPQVSLAYHARPGANAAAKVGSGEDVLHRTGDLGWLDGSGRLWFLGRSAHRVHGAGFVLDTAVVERITDAVPGIGRTALIGLGPAGRQRPVLCVELAPSAASSATAVLQGLRHALSAVPGGHRIATVLLHRRLPTDPRHNSRVDRDRLARWARRRLRRRRPGGVPGGGR
ncbi:AMP-binding protein [Kitasatospora sp. NBC_01300]|uniref:AMP-binding protein n=1 Tax=Kitasatospora sp. NBC_01300 TaxID=2903574 RepID=UPI002F91B754|nr:AMP-binding protein [Kitasatospora sp. NBC_01300]